MSSFSIDITRTKQYVDTLGNVSKRMRRMSEDNAFRRNDTHISGLDASLKVIKTNISALSKDVGKLEDALDKITSSYYGSEKALTSKNGSIFKVGQVELGSGSYSWSSNETNSSFDLLKASIGSATLALGGAYASDSKLPFGEDKVGTYMGKLSTEDSEHYFGKNEATLGNGLKSDLLTGRMDDHNKETEDGLEDAGLRKEKDIYKLNEDNYYDREATLLERDAKVSGKAVLYEGETNLSGRTKMNMSVGSAEAHASFSRGLYTLGSKDGKRYFSPGIKAEIGASASALTVGLGSQILGDENLGLSADLGIDVLHGEAKAEGALQAYDNEGKPDLQVGIGASGEAVLAQAEGSLDLNVLGGKVGVNASAGLGIGAHADFGIRDGKISADVGAYVGVGASAGFEIDVGGAVNALVDGSSAVYDFLEGV